jgi:hypothetical protein
MDLRLQTLASPSDDRNRGSVVEMTEFLQAPDQIPDSFEKGQDLFSRVPNPL